MGAKRPKFGAEGTVLENLRDILEKLFLRNVIRRKNIDILGLQIFFVIFEKLFFKTAIKSEN